MSSFPPPPPPPPPHGPGPSSPTGSPGFSAPPSLPGTYPAPTPTPVAGPSGPGGPLGPGEPWWKRRILQLPVWSLLAAVVLIAGAIVAVVATRSDDAGTVITSSQPDDTAEESETTEPEVTTDETTEETSEGTTEETTEETSAPTTDETSPTTEPETTVEETVVTDPPSSAVIPGAPAGARGTSAAPVPGGQVADFGDGWRVQVLSVVADGAAAVAAASEFNDPPPPGKTFTLVRVAVGYYGLADPAAPYLVDLSAVGAAKIELDNTCGLIPDELNLYNDLFSGATTTGNICFVTAPEDAAALQVYGSADFFGDQVFLAASSVPEGVTPLPVLRGPQPGATMTAKRASAVPLGTATDIGGGWQFTVTSPAHDITDAVVADNSFLDPLPEGYRYIGVDAVFTYNGTESSNVFQVTMKAVDDANTQLSTTCGSVPGEPDYFTDVFSGGSVNGTLCFVERADDVPSLVLYGTGGFDTNYVTFATR